MLTISSQQIRQLHHSHVHCNQYHTYYDIALDKRSTNTSTSNSELITHIQTCNYNSTHSFTTSIIHTSKVLYNCFGASCSNCQALSPMMMMKYCCRLGNSRRMPFVLACTPPPGLTTSHGCLLSLLVY